ncbi:hypothetical protein BT69DRAFT_224485 [Atractiella rhizophila]|nr:hypothetical protein BT69DRAFT_224485 [Atractiella rhizophila]
MRPKERGGKLISQAKSMFGENEKAKQNGNPTIPVPPQASTSRPAIQSRISASTLNPVSPTPSFSQSPDNKLYQTVLTQEVSKLLVQTYYTYTHPQIPILDSDTYLSRFEQCIDDPSSADQMTTCLLAVIQAFGSRVSDHPSVLPQPAPSLASLALAGSSSDLSPYGLARENFAKHMEQRALKIVDELGAMRRAEMDSIISLILLEMLLDYGDPKRSKGHTFLSAVIEHMREMRYQKGLDGDVETDSIKGINMMAIEGGLVWWFLYVRDALNACLSGRIPHVTDQDIELLSPVSLKCSFEGVMGELNSPDPTVVAHAAIIGLFSHWTHLAREIARTFLGPLPSSRASISEPDIRSFWQGTDESYMLSETFASRKNQVFGPMAEKFEGTLRVLTMSRATVTEAVHRAILGRWERARRDGTGSEGSPGFGMGGGIGALDGLKRESEVRVLRASREIAGLIGRQLNSNLFVGGGLYFDLTSATANILLDAPFVNTIGNEEWTVETKRRDVGSCIAAMKQMAWCWGNIHSDIVSLESRLQTLTSQSLSTASLSASSGIYAPGSYEPIIDPLLFSVPSLPALPKIPTLQTSDFASSAFADMIAEMSSGFMPSSMSVEEMLMSLSNPLAFGGVEDPMSLGVGGMGMDFGGAEGMDVFGYPSAVSGAPPPLDPPSSTGDVGWDAGDTEQNMQQPFFLG